MTPLLILGVGCSDFGDIDKNPNGAETPLTSALLSNGLNAFGNFAAGGGSFGGGLYAQYFSETQYTDNSIYAPQDLNWAVEMQGRMMDYQNIININSDPAKAATAGLNGSNNDQIAIARILKAYSFSILTDRYGDMPYFEALKGIATPAFDAQEDIYTDIFKELDEAVNQFDDGAPVKGDLLYGGDVTAWQKFANSHRLILALRVSKVNPTLGAAQFNDALNSPGGVFTSNADNAVMAYPGPPYNNPWFGIGADQGISTTVTSFLNAQRDERRWVFGNIPNPTTGDLIGVPPGLTREQAIAYTSAPATSSWSLILDEPYRAQVSSQFILTYADVLLARAEAALLGWAGTAAGANELMHAGIQASWEQWGVYDATAFNTYTTDTDVTFADGDATAAAKLGRQRWLTFYPNGAQGWAEWRRTGFPALTPSPNAVNNSKQIPTRYPYPSVEYTYNQAGVDAAVARMGGDTDAQRVWWDVN